MKLSSATFVALIACVGSLVAEEPTLPIENEVSFTVDFVTFKEAKPKFRPVHQEQPVYPAELLSKRVEGFAIVAFLVDLEGKTSQCQVAAATDAAFGDAARAAIERWRFSPPKFGGKPGMIAMQLPIEFKIEPTADSSKAIAVDLPAARPAQPVAAE